MTLMTPNDPNFDPNGNHYISTKNQVLGSKGQIFVYLLYTCAYIHVWKIIISSRTY